MKTLPSHCQLFSTVLFRTHQMLADTLWSPVRDLVHKNWLR